MANRKFDGDELIVFSDGLNGNPVASSATKKPSERESTKLAATTVVNGKPTAKIPIDNGSLSPSALELNFLDLNGKNWVGQLLEYRQAHTENAGPSFEESTVENGRFAYSVIIGERPSPISDPGASFTRKKDAKQHAAKLAIEWLIENQYIPSDGGVPLPKTRSTPSPTHHPRLIPVSESADDDVDDETLLSSVSPPLPPVHKVPDLCTKLGFPPPLYNIMRDPDLTVSYSGHAFFASPSPELEGAGLDGPVAEVSHQDSRKHAKEAIAEQLVEPLEALLKKRMKDTRPGPTSRPVDGGEPRSVSAKEAVVNWQHKESLLD